MDKVRKIQLFIDNSEQNLIIDKALQKCAALLIEKFVEKSDEQTPFRDSFELKEDRTDELVSVFEKSPYYTNDGIDAGDSFEEVIFKIAEFNDGAAVRILYPVLLYTLVLKNYDKKNTVNRRKQRGSKRWGNTSELFAIPTVEKQNSANRVNKTVREAIGKLQETLQNLTIINKEKYEQMLDMPVIDEGNYQLYELNVLEDLLTHAETARSLLDSRKVGWLETVACRGLFAREVLLSQLKHSAPIDTILRLYVLEAIDGLLFNTERLSNGYRYPDLPKEYLLISFLENDGTYTWSETKEDDKDNTDEPKEIDLDQTGEIEGDFAGIYRNLSVLKFDHEDARDMIDYFFSESRLKWFLNSGSHIMQYAETVIAGLQKGHGLDERYLDLDQLYTPGTTKLFEGWDKKTGKLEL